MKKFVRTTIFWGIGFSLFLGLLAYIQKPSDRVEKDSICSAAQGCCRKSTPVKGGELLFESLSRQFVSTICTY